MHSLSHAAKIFFQVLKDNSSLPQWFEKATVSKNLSKIYSHVITDQKHMYEKEKEKDKYLHFDRSLYKQPSFAPKINTSSLDAKQGQPCT